MTLENVCQQKGQNSDSYQVRRLVFLCGSCILLWLQTLNDCGIKTNLSRVWWMWNLFALSSTSESTQNANGLTATDWISPLFMQSRPQCPTAGVCCSCRSFIRSTMEVVSATSHHLTPGLYCQYNGSQSTVQTIASFQLEARFQAAGRVFEELRQPGENALNFTGT